MTHSELKNFYAYNQEHFDTFTRRYGFSAVACFQVSGRMLQLILCSTTNDTQWPATANFSSDYTPNRTKDMPVGWIKPSFTEKDRKSWPRGVSFYFPAQDWSVTKLIFVTLNASGRRTMIGNLDGALEALAANFCATIDQSENQHFISEADHLEQVDRVGVDLKMMLDHELRTPMTSILGYSQLLESCSEGLAEGDEIKNYSSIILKECNTALAAMNQVSALFEKQLNAHGPDSMEIIDLGEVCSEMTDLVKENYEDWRTHIGKNSPLKLNIRVPQDKSMKIKGIRNMMKKAIFEVVKNGIMYSNHDRLELTLYKSDNMAVIDFEDDGDGVHQGIEELIFIRFFQGPMVIHKKKIKRGLGNGLYTARTACELHGGSLKYIRGIGKNGVFRMLIPLNSDS